MKLVFPTLEHKQQAIDYINEFYQYNSAIYGVGSLHKFLKESTYEEWLKKIVKDFDAANLKENRVPALTYFAVVDDEIVGMCNIRFGNNELIRKYSGHIGYSIRPTCRNKGYGTKQLSLAIDIMKQFGVDNVIVMTAYDNEASKKVVKNNNGIFFEELDSERGKIHRHIIMLNAF